MMLAARNFLLLKLKKNENLEIKWQSYNGSWEGQAAASARNTSFLESK